MTLAYFTTDFGRKKLTNLTSKHQKVQIYGKNIDPIEIAYFYKVLLPNMVITVPNN